jgi:glycosyltransferase involved in cell wall biosynthesis
MGMDAEAIELARRLDVYERFVFFNFGWVPYAERANYLLEADLGISAHFDSVETRFAFRTRLLDYLWAGLPIVTTRGDVLAELVEERQLGHTVAEGDVDGWVRAVEGLLDDERERESAARNIAETRGDYEWPVVVRTLARLVSGDERSRPVPSLTKVTRYVWVSAVAGVIKHGLRGALARALEIARRRPSAG